MRGGQWLNDLRAPAVTMHIAEAANVHQEVKAQRSTGVEGAKRLIVPPAMPQPKLDDLVDARFRKSGPHIARLPVRVLPG